MCAYYPKSRIITGLKANPGEFTLPDGKEYSGDYYVTYNGTSYTGVNPQAINSQPLTKITVPQEGTSNIVINRDNLVFNYLNRSNINITELLDPISYYPVPTEDNYNKGKITRYFAKQRIVRKFKIIEIDKITYEDILNQQGVYNYPMWKVISLFWRISPSLSNEQNIHKFTESVDENNRRIIDIKDKSFQGLKQYITNYIQFSKP